MPLIWKDNLKEIDYVSIVEQFLKINILWLLDVITYNYSCIMIDVDIAVVGQQRNRVASFLIVARCNVLCSLGLFGHLRGSLFQGPINSNILIGRRV